MKVLAVSKHNAMDICLGRGGGVKLYAFFTSALLVSQWSASCFVCLLLGKIFQLPLDSNPCYAIPLNQFSVQVTPATSRNRTLQLVCDIRYVAVVQSQLGVVRRLLETLLKD
jgi:hypothetical protein